ncbi:MAG: hypothetical protein BWY58_01397 [Chloroflexi bacterium ADurb.Bin344]|nr:MAG: hypothetical protein BWY58_01397 [Chloroflexi bacterium ADurb.Bin344]
MTAGVKPFPLNPQINCKRIVSNNDTPATPVIFRQEIFFRCSPNRCAVCAAVVHCKRSFLLINKR